LQEQIFLRAQALVTSLSLVPFTQHDPPIHKHFFCSLIIRHAREYSKTTYALAPFLLTPTSFNITLTLNALHLDLDDYFLLLLKDYEPYQYLEFSSDSFKLAFQSMPHLSASSPFGIIF
jgi:hypothetical protein